MNKSYNNPPISLQLFFGILIVGFISMLIATEFDITWTQFVHSHRIDWYFKFMNESISNGDKQLGSLDFIYALIVIPGLIFYFLAWLFPVIFQNKNRSGLINKIVSIRPYLGFLVTSSFCSAFLFVHTTKQIVGRGRPMEIFDWAVPFSEWYEIGPYFITQGSFSGSFPSGHTATASILIALAYIAFNIMPNRQWLSQLLFAISLVFAGGMGISRMMSASHWATDVVFTVFSCWAITHVIFFWGLRIPSQIDYFRKHGKHSNNKFFFELQICFYMFFFCLGIWAFFTGIRSSHMSEWKWLQVLIPLGLSSIVFYFEKIRKVSGLKENQLAEIYTEQRDAIKVSNEIVNS